MNMGDFNFRAQNFIDIVCGWNPCNGFYKPDLKVRTFDTVVVKRYRRYDRVASNQVVFDLLMRGLVP